jgi:predicted enzyme related to lactoylglutathione lyase
VFLDGEERDPSPNVCNLGSTNEEGKQMTNPFVHVELNSPDPEKAKTFYGKLFQWQLEDMPDQAVPDHSYTMIKVGEGTGGGIMKQVPHGPAGWIPYVLVDDLRAATDKAKSLGGKVMKDITEVPDMGWFSIIEDPTGSILGLWKANPKMKQAH